MSTLNTGVGWIPPSRIFPGTLVSASPLNARPDFGNFLVNQPTMKQRCASAGAIIGGTLMAATSVFAQGLVTGTGEGYPVKPVRVILGFAPGGATDIIARMLAQKLSENLRSLFVVENRPGAGGTIADAFVANAAPDGYTLLAEPSSFAITPALYTRLSYDVIKDFAPISLVLESPFLLITHPTLPAKSLKELVALAKAKPGVLNCASGGYGGGGHLACELFNQMAEVKSTHVPYKSTGPAVIDVMAGQVHMMFGNVVSSAQFVKIGKLRALAVTSAKRSLVTPELPTVAEAVPGYQATTWHGWVAPRGTPASVLNRLNAEIVKIVKASDMVKQLASEGSEPVGSTPEEFSVFLAREVMVWGKVVKNAGIKPQ